MASITVTSVTGLGQPDIYTGLEAQGTGTADKTLTVHYKTQSGAMSADKSPKVNSDGSWSVKFNGEFSAGTEVKVIAKLGDTEASKTVTLPKASG
ncbi:hypothetical protein V5T82_01550 [Magnetovibrio sp. PR-2]|uniref:hypothetical protein n=1 Tax=Magnetovibrio sp. PR-2 TaxID=3120356 RepID=UPI002FCE572A